MRQSHKTILIWAILILMFVSIYSMFTDSSSKEKEIDSTAFRALLTNKEEAQKIEKIQVEERGQNSGRFVVTMKNDATKRVVFGDYRKLMDAVDASGVPTTSKIKDESSIWPQVLVWWLPMLLLVGIFFLFMRQLQSGGGKAM